MRRGLLSAGAAMVVLAFAGVWHGEYAKSPVPSPPAASPPAASSPAASPPAASSPTPTGGASLLAKMAGANETPPNKSTATGTAKITVDTLHDNVCWTLSVQKLQGTVTRAHIQRAPAGQTGPTVLNLSPQASGSSTQGCKRVGPPLARGIVKHPDAYYVNLDTSKFPDGEIRGQL